MKKLFTAVIAVSIPILCHAITFKELKELIDESTPDLVARRAVVSSYRLMKKATMAGYFPKVTLGASAEESYPDFYENWNQKYSLSVEVTATPIDLKRNSQLRVDRYRIEVGEADLEALKLELYFRGFSTLLKLKAQKEKIRIRRELVEDLEEIYRVAEEKYRQGLVLITDVLKAKAELEKAKGELKRAEGEYRKTFNDLNELVNFRLQEGEEPEVELKESFLLPEKEELIEIALRERPEIKKAMKDLKLARAKVELERRALSPSVSLSASYVRSDTEIPVEEDYYSISAGLTFPIFDSGLTSFRTAVAKKQVAEKEAILKKTENAVKAEVLNALESFKTSVSLLNSAREFLKFSKTAYERVLNEYRFGVSDITALLQTHRTLKDAQESYIDALLQLNVSHLQIQKATGKLLEGKR